MKYNNIGWSIRSPFFAYCKKHFCPDCDERLQRVWASRIVNAESLEGRYGQYRFNFSDEATYGDVKMMWIAFTCPFCGRRVSVGELLAREKRK